MKQGQILLQLFEIKTEQNISILEFCILRSLLVIDHLLKLPIMSIMPKVLVCCNGLWPGVQKKEVACLASIRQQKPSPKTYSKEMKNDSEKASLSREMFPTCNGLIRQSTQASICGKFQNEQEI